MSQLTQEQWDEISAFLARHPDAVGGPIEIDLETDTFVRIENPSRLHARISST